jgi:SAM-dependent methyltransferase
MTDAPLSAQTLQDEHAPKGSEHRRSSFPIHKEQRLALARNALTARGRQIDFSRFRTTRAFGVETMDTKVLPRQAVDWLKERPQLYRAARSVRMGVGQVLPPRRIEGIPGRVHFNDFMLEASNDQGVGLYRSRADAVLDCIEDALTQVGRRPEDVESWLDFGCGYGRVLRFLLARGIAASRVEASDVIQDGVSFCVSEFGVHGKRSAYRMDHVDLGRKYEVVYAISVVTHLNPEETDAFLRLIGRVVEPGGLVLFTTHGDWWIENQSATESLGTWAHKAVARVGSSVGEQVEAHGHAFLPYTYYSGDAYGLAWHRPDYIKARMQALHSDSMRLINYRPARAEWYQDAFVYQRMP